MAAHDIGPTKVAAHDVGPAMVAAHDVGPAMVAAHDFVLAVGGVVCRHGRECCVVRRHLPRVVGGTAPVHNDAGSTSIHR